MAKGALKTFFRQDAGYPDMEMEQPDLTDFLLDSMIQNGPREGGMPIPTSGSRISSMAGMRGYPGQQGAPGPQMPAPPPQPDVTVSGRAYPSMPGPLSAPQMMPQMPKPGWIDYLSQAGGALADGMNARSGIRSNFFGQIGAQQQGLRDREFQHAMAEKAAMENAARMAHEYEWRKYGAGVQEARFDQKAKEREADVKFRDQLLAQQKAQAEWAGNLQSEVLPMRFDAAETEEEVNAMEEKSLLETGGNPALMKKVKDAAAVQRTALQWKRLGQPQWAWPWETPSHGPQQSPAKPLPYTAPPSPSLYGDRLPYGPWVPFQQR